MVVVVFIIVVGKVDGFEARVVVGKVICFEKRSSVNFAVGCDALIVLKVDAVEGLEVLNVVATVDGCDVLVVVTTE